MTCCFLFDFHIHTHIRPEEIDEDIHTLHTDYYIWVDAHVCSRGLRGDRLASSFRPRTSTWLFEPFGMMESHIIILIVARRDMLQNNYRIIIRIVVDDTSLLLVPIDRRRNKSRTVRTILVILGSLVLRSERQKRRPHYY
jgi:hypothetical protein